MSNLEQYKNNIVLKILVGSHLYKINHEKSDKDYKGIFILPKLDYNKQDSRLINSEPYINQINDDKHNEVYYELRKVIELISQGNPNVIELFFADDEFILIKNDLLFPLFKIKDLFLNKKFANSLLGFISSQVRKGTGKNKKSFKPIDKELKTPLDFCFVLKNNKRKVVTYTLKKYLKENKINQQSCGLSHIPNSSNNFNLFWDKKQQRMFFDKKNIFNKLEYKITKLLLPFGFKMGKGYKGIELLDNKSNNLRVSEIPINDKAICQIVFNHSAYCDYIKEYNEYWDWVEKRNEERYIENQLASKGYDTKNMAHCWRLLCMLEHLLIYKELIIEAKDKETIWKIKRGEYEYNNLYNLIENKLFYLTHLLSKTDLQENININLLSDIEQKIRKDFYGRNN